MKLVLVSIIFRGVTYSTFAFGREQNGKMQIVEKVYNDLARIAGVPNGSTFTRA